MIGAEKKQTSLICLKLSFLFIEQYLKILYIKKAQIRSIFLNAFSTIAFMNRLLISDLIFITNATLLFAYFLLKPGLFVIEDHD